MNILYRPVSSLIYDWQPHATINIDCGRHPRIDWRWTKPCTLDVAWEPLYCLSVWPARVGRGKLPAGWEWQDSLQCYKTTTRTTAPRNGRDGISVKRLTPSSHNSYVVSSLSHPLLPTHNSYVMSTLSHPLLPTHNSYVLSTLSHPLLTQQLYTTVVQTY